MGNFDQIIIEYPLPDFQAQNMLFQTKSFYSLSDSYLVRRDGSLIRKKRIPQIKEQVEANSSLSKNLLLEKKFIETDGEFFKYNGNVIINSGNVEGPIYEYKLQFLDGVLQQIEKTNFKEKFLEKFSF